MTPNQTPPARWVKASAAFYVLSIVAATVGFTYLHFSGLDPFVGWADVADAVMWGALSLSLFASGAMIAIRRPENPIGRLLLFAGLTFAIAVTSAVPLEMLASAGRLEAAGLLEATVSGALTMWLPLVMGAVILFPTGTLLSSRWRWLAWLTGVLLILGFAASVTNGGWAGDLEEVVYANPLRESLAPIGDILSFLWQPVALAVVLGAAVEVIVRFRRSTGEEREQMKWLTLSASAIAFAILAVALTSSGTATDNAWQTLLIAGSLATVPIGIAIAVLKYRLYDIDVVIRRTLTYATVIAVLGVGFAAAMAVPLLLLGTSDTASPPDWLIAGATLGAFLLFSPLRKRVQVAVERRFNRLPYDPQAVNDRLHIEVRDTVDSSALSSAWTAAVVDSLEPASAGVWLRRHP